MAMATYLDGLYESDQKTTWMELTRDVSHVYDCSGFMSQTNAINEKWPEPGHLTSYLEDVFKSVKDTKQLPPGTFGFHVPKKERAYLDAETNTELSCMKRILMNEMETCQSILDAVAEAVNEDTVETARSYLALRHEAMDVMVTVIERIAAAEAIQYGPAIEKAKETNLARLAMLSE